MIWVTWRQHRGEALVASSVLALLAALLVKTGLDMASAYQQLGLADCVAHPNHLNCDTVANALFAQYGFLYNVVGWLGLVPALLAILIGAPVVARELEQGTHRLVWTQSVTRYRWLAVKLIGVLGGGLVASALLAGVLTWWLGPFDQLLGNFRPQSFDFEGTVFLAYTAFALSLAIAAGALLRRAIPAMVVTLAGFLAVRLPVELFLRPNYLAPITVTWDDLAGKPVANGPTDWVTGRGWLNGATGVHLPDSRVYPTCLQQGGTPNQNPFAQCTHAHGWLEYVTYQPADRFWLFQGIETAIFVSLALALVALTIWWVRRRLA